MNIKRREQHIKKQYYQDNKAKIDERIKRWKQANHERLNTVVNCACGGHYLSRCKARHEQSAKHLNFLNPPKQETQQEPEPIICPKCGVSFKNKTNFKLHGKSWNCYKAGLPQPIENIQHFTQKNRCDTSLRKGFSIKRKNQKNLGQT